MKSSSASLFGIVVAILSVISAVLLITSGNYGIGLLAIALGLGTAVLLFTIQNITGHLEELRHDIDTLRSNLTSNPSFENSLRELKTEVSKLSKASDISISLPAPSPQLPNNIGAATTALSPTPTSSSEAVIPVPTTKKESYQPFIGLPLPASQNASSLQQQNSNQNLNSKFPAPSDDPNRTNASFAVPKNPITSPNTVVSNTGSHDSMETTQSFLPHVPTGHPERFPNESAESNLSTQATIGFDSSSLPPPPNEIGHSSYSEAPKTPSKVHSKIKKRYSTFAGLSLNDDSQEANKYKEDLLTPPPPPPPPNKVEKKRYSTFAGLALGERSKITPPSSNPSSITSAPAPKSANPLSILSPSTITNLGFSKNTDGTGVSREELMDLSSPQPTAPAIIPVPPQIPASPTKGTRKRYQTFMGLSLSKTPQPIKRYEEPPMDATAPLSLAGTGASYAKAPAPSSLQAAINRGQQGNLVDGFCSLCGSPQAAANDYATTGSEPEFCWYCGAKLR